MYVRRNPNSPYCWIPDQDPAIDREKWTDEARTRYFGFRGEVDYTLPPILPGETPVRVYLRPLSHGDYMRIQALEDQKKTDCYSDPELQNEIIRLCVTDLKGVGEETVLPDGTTTVRELPREALFDAAGVINEEGLGFFQGSGMAAGAASVAWVLSHPRFLPPRAPVQTSET